MRARAIPLVLTVAAIMAPVVAPLAQESAMRNAASIGAVEDMRYATLRASVDVIMNQYKAQIDAILACQKNSQFWDGASCKGADIPATCGVGTTIVKDTAGRLRCMSKARINLDGLLARRGYPRRGDGPNIYDSFAKPNDASTKVGTKWCKELGYPDFSGFLLGSKRGKDQATMYRLNPNPSATPNDRRDLTAGDPNCNGCGARVAEIECAVYQNP